MNSTQQPGSEDGFKAAADKRGCYCGLWDTNPSLYEEQGLPRGFCGKCLRCGQAGHTRHFPGPVAFTGAWCDKCYRLLAWTWPFRSVGGWVFILMLIAVVWTITDRILS